VLKTLDDLGIWHACFHEVGHIKFFYGGYPIFILVDNVVEKPSDTSHPIFNVVTITPREVFPDHPPQYFETMQ